MISLLIEHGANVNAMSKSGWTPVSFAMSDQISETLEGLVLIKQKEDCCKLLIEAGADVNAIKMSDMAKTNLDFLNELTNQTLLPERLIE